MVVEVGLLGSVRKVGGVVKKTWVLNLTFFAKKYFYQHIAII